MFLRSQLFLNTSNNSTTWASCFSQIVVFAFYYPPNIQQTTRKPQSRPTPSHFSTFFVVLYRSTLAPRPNPSPNPNSPFMMFSLLSLFFSLFGSPISLLFFSYFSSHWSPIFLFFIFFISTFHIFPLYFLLFFLLFFFPTSTRTSMFLLFLVC